MDQKPRAPDSMSPYARACLEAIAVEGLGDKISLGGALGLAYFHEYRQTVDADAWWAETAVGSDRRRVVALIGSTLGRWGETQVRSWGDVTSIELKLDGKVAFSFQIAVRSARLRDSLAAPWPKGLFLDHIDDLLAAKMEALVNRGAPRDFRDIHEVCVQGITDTASLWRLWGERRRAAGDDEDTRRAALAARTHLERIERARPMESIPGEAEREEARAVRAWIREEFLRGLV